MKQRIYTIETRPTEPWYSEDGYLIGWTIAYGLSRQVENVQRHDVACTTFDQLDAAIDRAAASNPSSHVMVTVHVQGRKPAGFDARYANIRPRSKQNA